MFKWANLFIGQTDVADDKSAPGMYYKLRRLLDKTHVDLLDKIFFIFFDGASAMKSTPLYVGLDSNPAGTSLVAQLKNAGARKTTYREYPSKVFVTFLI